MTLIRYWFVCLWALRNGGTAKRSGNTALIRAYRGKWNGTLLVPIDHGSIRRIKQRLDHQMWHRLRATEQARVRGTLCS